MKYWLTGLLTVCFSGVALADGVLLANGRTLVGIAHEESDRWVVRTGRGDIRVPKSDVQSVVIGRTSLHEFDERIAALYGCPAVFEMFALALWAQQQGLIRYVNGLLMRTIELDPDHPEARRMLGFVRLEGQWLTVTARDAQLAALKCCGAAGQAKARSKRRASLETTPYTLGIPMSQARPTRGYVASGGYSMWQGVVPAQNLTNLPAVGPRVRR